PAMASGTYHIQVTTNNGSSSNVAADQFTYVATGVPTVSSLGTSTGSTAGGTSVTITGTNFSSVSQVWFGNVAAASYTVNSTTSTPPIPAPSPSQYAGVADVTVETASGVSATSSSDRFTYTNASAPTVTSLGSSSGSTAGGTSVTITGTNFTGAVAVWFGSVP